MVTSKNREIVPSALALSPRLRARERAIERWTDPLIKTKPEISTYESGVVTNHAEHVATRVQLELKRRVS